MSIIPTSSKKKTSLFETLSIATSLKPYIFHVKNLLENESTIKAGFYQFIVNEISAYPELEKPLKLDDIERYKKVLELVYATLSYDLLSAENDNLWAFSMPFQPKIFYSTNALNSIVKTNNKNGQIERIIENCLTPVQEWRLIYSFILYKLYGYESTENNIYYSFIDESTELEKYYLINIDFKFVELKIHEGKKDWVVPELDFEILHKYMQSEEDFEELKNVIPLNNFDFEGFSILRFQDVRIQHLVTDIENLISNRANQDPLSIYQEIIRILKIVTQKSDVEMGLLPFLKINNQLVFATPMAHHSLLAGIIMDRDASESNKNEDLCQYFKSSQSIFFNDIFEDHEKTYPFLKNVKEKGIVSLLLTPVFVNKKLVGLIELFSEKKDAINKKDAHLLDVVLRQIGELFENNINEFESNIENVIKQNFTSLHHSVQWKFNEIAWQYLKENLDDNANAELKKIQFKDVYPLYGEIDIRNSTIERNTALQKDMLNQLGLLQETLVAITEKIEIDLVKEMIFGCKKWTKSVEDLINSSEEFGLNNFLTFEVEPLLRHLKENFPEMQKIIDAYFDSTHEINGLTHENRKKLEKSIALINKVINTHLEGMVNELQLAYPFYFEKFKTDGIEYDIYIGQSIAPHRPFDALYLANARLWQLKSMATIMKACQQLSHQLPTFLETTNLIFVHSNAIDISFRNDERRFDVEGAYNIRYQVIKKRIDKVNVKDTEERLTQPHKIAIVYFDQKEADEYIKFINSLIAQEVFNDDLECLELEDLQGVIGLKALRVSIKTS